MINGFSLSLMFALVTALLCLIIICVLAYHYLRAQIQHVASEAGGVYSLKAERDKVTREIELHQQQLVALRESLSAPELERIRNDKAALEREYDVKFRQLEDVKSELNSLGIEIDKVRSTKAGVEKEIQEQQQRLEELKEKKAQVNLDEQAITHLSNLKASIEKEVQALESGLVEARGRYGKELETLASDHKKAEEEFRQKRLELRERHEGAVKACERLDATIKEREHELDILTAREQAILSAMGDGQEDSSHEKDHSDDSLFILPDRFVAYAKRRAQETTLDERTQLEKFQEALETRHISFTDRTLRSFHTSLKCNDISPLTVLAGVSGTGKTLLPLKYAEFFGIPSLVVPVQPRWDSHDDLFGSYNYIEKRFVATELGRSLVVMDEFNNKDRRDAGEWSKRLLLVLLDEMNLARTEYYFSEFLSRLELRREINPALAEQREKAELLTGKDAKTKVWVGTNVLFVGTMNEDESTQTLSDKVLDRANVLRFSAPSFATEVNSNGSGPSKSIEIDRVMTKELWDKWRREEASAADLPAVIYASLDEISKAMSKIGRPFGHRLMESMKQYIRRYPIRDEHGFKLAFGDQVEQRLLPKLRGVQLSEPNRNALNTIVTMVDKVGDDELASGIQQSLSSADLDLFFWAGLNREAN